MYPVYGVSLTYIIRNFLNRKRWLTNFCKTNHMSIPTNDARRAEKKYFENYIKIELSNSHRVILPIFYHFIFPQYKNY